MPVFQRTFWTVGLVAALSFAAAGCRQEPAKANAAKPPEVLVARPVSEGYTEFEEFSGHVWPAKSVEIRARVSGQLDAVLFADGSAVTAGEPLFQIDPRPYQAAAEKSVSAVRQAQSRLARLEVQLRRARALISDAAIAQEEVDVLQSDRDEAAASLSSAEASLAMAQLDLDFTRISAPMSGRISRRLVDAGNLIRADETLLANLLTTDPVDAYFDVDERTVLKIRRLPAADAAISGAARPVEVQLSVADQNDFSLRGTIDFVDHQLDASTGTLRMRAKVDNADQLLSPGMFVRCRYPLGGEVSGLFVPEEALGSDQGQPYLYVVNEREEVEYRRVQTGPLLSGRRVVEDNLAETDRVIVAGMQRVRPGIKVSPRMTEPRAGERHGALPANQGLASP